MALRLTRSGSRAHQKAALLGHHRRLLSPLTAEALEAAFKTLLPADARAVAVAVADAPDEWPLPLELVKARTVRQREFIAGRWCATRALMLLGVTQSVGRADTRAPVWPMGVTGSITHSRDFAAAAVAKVTSLGIDLEPYLSAKALEDLRHQAISDDEWRVLGQSVELATALFSAKESIFKCEHPRTGVFLDFTDAELKQVTPEALTLKLPEGDVQVRYALAHGHALTAMIRP